MPTEREPAEQAHFVETADESTPREDSTVPGDAAGVPVPSDVASPGTSEELSAVDGVLVHPTESDTATQAEAGPPT